MRRRPPALLAALLAPALLVAGCGTGAEAGDGDGTTVVTSTNVYASLVEAIGGDAVNVRPIIDDPAQDPHEYEATARDQLELSRADLVVMNGGGYDAFVTTMLDAIDTDPAVIDTVAISGLPGAGEAVGHDHDHGEHDHESDHGEHDHDAEAADDSHSHDDDASRTSEGADAHDGHSHGSFNEHVWYSVPTMLVLVDEIETHLIASDPDSADDFGDRATALRGDLEELNTRIAAVEDAHAGTRAAVTEPVSLRLFDDMGLENVVPDRFVAAVESGSDVSPLVVAEATEALADEVRVFAYNTQTSGPEAEKLRSEAEDLGIPVVEVAETMPSGSDYVSWMSDTVDAVERALS